MLPFARGRLTAAPERIVMPLADVPLMAMSGDDFAVRSGRARATGRMTATDYRDGEVG